MEPALYKLLIQEFQLSFRCLDSTSAVGSFFWWTHVGDKIRRYTPKDNMAPTERTKAVLLDPCLPIANCGWSSSSENPTWSGKALPEDGRCC